ncbi:MAG: hypothetical protein Q7I93_03055, partial [Syntrophales bacterium]|nr:hypothetical protein [Syntrophales bacterium]
MQRYLAENRRDFGIARHFGKSEGVQSVVMIPSLQGISASPVKVQPRAARDKEPEGLLMFGIFALDEPLPLPVLVNYIKDENVR